MTRTGVRLLDVEPDLGSGLSATEFERLRGQLVVAWVELPAGPLGFEEIAQAEGVWGEAVGALVLDGVLTQDLRLIDRTCTRLLVAGDLVLFDGDAAPSLPLERTWSVQDRARVAVLDHRLLSAGARWPTLLKAVFERAAKGDRLTLTQQAISQLPRVEDRLLAFFWMVADRRGQVGQDGVRLRLPVTHEALGRMVGARRPTVSLGLAALAESGLLTGDGVDWRLSHESLDALSSPASSRPAELPQPGPARVLAVGPSNLLEGDAGHEVVRVADADAALAVLPDGDFKVVVVDAAAIGTAAGAVVDTLRAGPSPRLVVVDDGSAPADLLAAAHEHLPAPAARNLWDLVDLQLARAATRSAGGSARQRSA